MEYLPCACASARQLARVLTQLYDQRLRGLGVEAPQFAMLMTLEQRGACTSADLAAAYGFDKTTVSRNLKVLERQQLIQFSVQKDRRKHEVRLTRAGRKLVGAGMPIWQATQDDLKAMMSGEKWRLLFETFRAATNAVRQINGQIE